MFTLTFKKMSNAVIFSLFLMVFSPLSYAENMKKFGDLEVHYIGLSTSILQPEIAKAYGLERSRYRGFVNISILDTSQPGKPAITAGLSGTATNLVGQQMGLEFQQVKEGSAIYYLASVKYPNDETYTFNITINNNGQEYLLTFKQKFYVEQ